MPETQSQETQAELEVTNEKPAATQLPVPSKSAILPAPVPVMPGNLEGLWKLSDALARAQILPPHLTDNGRAEFAVVKANVFWIIQCGAELQIPATQAIMGIAVINGRPCVYGDLMIGKVRASGLANYIKETKEGEGTNLVATCEAQRSDTGEVITRTYSWAEADQVVQKSKFGDKKLTDKDTYQNYGPRMIQMRARAYCLRDGFSDVLKGIRVAEEEEDQAFVGPTHALEAAPRPQQPKIAEPIEGEIVNAAENTPREPTGYEITAELLISGLEAAASTTDLDGTADLDDFWDNSTTIYEDLPGDLRQKVADKYDELREGLFQSPLAAG